MSGASQVRPVATARKSEACKLRPATLNDYQQIAALEARYGLEAKGYQEWSHLWLENPAYKELQGEWAIGWVLEDKNNRIVGSLANIPLLYELHGKRLLAVSGRGLVVEPQHRSASLVLLNRLIHQPGVDLYLNNTIGTESAESFKIFECPRVPVGSWDEAAFWITGYLGFSEYLLTVRNHKFAKHLSYALGTALRVKDYTRANRFREGGAQLESCVAFDRRFDSFWEDLKQGNPHLLLADRSLQGLEWHFKYALLNRRVWILTAVDRGRLLAYAIFERKDSSHAGVTLKRMRLVDFQSLDMSTALLPSILALALNRCREEGFHVLESVGRWLKPGEPIASIAPYRRKLATWTYFYRPNRPDLKEPLEDVRTWIPSLFDGDATL